MPAETRKACACRPLLYISFSPIGPIPFQECLLANSASSQIRLAILDDSRLVREALAEILQPVDGITVIAAVGSLSSLTHGLEPDVMLVDAGLGDEDSLDAVRILRRLMPKARIVLLDLVPAEDEIVEFVAAGASGFVLKDATLDELVSTIRTAAAGDKVLPRSMTQSLFAQIASLMHGVLPEPLRDSVRITPRERQVVALIGDGLSNREISERLDIAPHTVKSHVRNVMEKLALHTRLQIAAYSHRDFTG